MATVEVEGQYLEGHEGIARVGYEAGGAISPTATTLPTLPTTELLGYAAVPSFNLAENPMPIEGVGSAEPFDHVLQRREPSGSGSMVLSGGAALKKFLRSILKKDASSGIPDGAHSMCVPQIAVIGAAANEYDPLRGIQWAGRGGIMSSISATLAMNQVLRMDWTAEFLTVVEGAIPTAPTKSQIMTAAGKPFSVHDMSLTYADGSNEMDLQPVVESLTFRITRVVKRRGIRKAAGILFRCARKLTPGKITYAVELTLSNPVAAIPTSLTCLLNNGEETLIIVFSGLKQNIYSMNGPTSESEFGFGLSLVATSMTVS